MPCLEYTISSKRFQSVDDVTLCAELTCVCKLFVIVRKNVHINIVDGTQLALGLLITVALLRSVHVAHNTQFQSISIYQV